jgi:DNA-binding transcriptional ArsR family regulator
MDTRRSTAARDADLDDAFFALSHRARRRILQQLSGAHEMRVTDLARRHRLSLNTVSKHVVVLERARLVRRRVVGREHLIRMNPKRLGEVERWLEKNSRFWTQQLNGLAAFFEKQEKQR